MFPRHDDPRRSPFTPYTALLALLWLVLVVYIVTHPDPIGVIILIVMGVFIVAPMLFIWALLFRAKRLRMRDGPGNEGEYGMTAGQNGRYAAGENGAHDGQQYESDEASGEIPEQTPEEGGENP